MSVATQSEYDTHLVHGIQAALRKARALGYCVETMDVTASLAQGICHIHFTPLAPPATAARCSNFAAAGPRREYWS